MIFRCSYFPQYRMKNVTPFLTSSQVAPLGQTSGHLQYYNMVTPIEIPTKYLFPTTFVDLHWVEQPCSLTDLSAISIFSVFFPNLAQIVFQSAVWKNSLIPWAKGGIILIVLRTSLCCNNISLSFRVLQTCTQRTHGAHVSGHFFSPTDFSLNAQLPYTRHGLLCIPDSHNSLLSSIPRKYPEKNYRFAHRNQQQSSYIVCADPWWTTELPCYVQARHRRRLSTRRICRCICGRTT